MKIRFGYELVYDCPQNTAMILMLHAQPNSSQRLLIPDRIRPPSRLCRVRPIETATGIFALAWRFPRVASESALTDCWRIRVCRSRHF